MQTERVTFLTTPDHKAALDAYAARNGRSVGHVLREVSTRYITEDTEPELTAEQEAELASLVAEVNAAIPKMAKTLDNMCERLETMHLKNDRFLRELGVR